MCIFHAMKKIWNFRCRTTSAIKSILKICSVVWCFQTIFSYFILILHLLCHMMIRQTNGNRQKYSLSTTFRHSMRSMTNKSKWKRNCKTATAHIERKSFFFHIFPNIKMHSDVMRKYVSSDEHNIYFYYWNLFSFCVFSSFDASNEDLCTRQKFCSHCGFPFPSESSSTYIFFLFISCGFYFSHSLILPSSLEIRICCWIMSIQLGS